MAIVHVDEEENENEENRFSFSSSPLSLLTQTGKQRLEKLNKCDQKKGNNERKKIIIRVARVTKQDRQPLDESHRAYSSLIVNTITLMTSAS